MASLKKSPVTGANAVFMARGPGQLLVRATTKCMRCRVTTIRREDRYVGYPNKDKQGERPHLHGPPSPSVSLSQGSFPNSLAIALIAISSMFPLHAACLMCLS